MLSKTLALVTRAAPSAMTAVIVLVVGSGVVSAVGQLGVIV